jgi:hypothetical protein
MDLLWLNDEGALSTGMIVGGHTSDVREVGGAGAGWQIAGLADSTATADTTSMAEQYGRRLCLADGTNHLNA